MELVKPSLKILAAAAWEADMVP